MLARTKSFRTSFFFLAKTKGINLKNEQTNKPCSSLKYTHKGREAERGGKKMACKVAGFQVCLTDQE